MDQGAVVPLTHPTPTPLPGGRSRRRTSNSGQRDSADRHRTRDMINYIAAALDPAVGAGARLLALQCALRASTVGAVRLPYGLVRSSGVRRSRSCWSELEHEGWLRPAWATAQPGGSSSWDAQLLDHVVLLQNPGRRARRSAADWALRMMAHARRAEANTQEQLVYLVLASHASLGTRRSSAEAERLARCSGLPLVSIPFVLAELSRKRLLHSWHLDTDLDDLHWSFPDQGA